MTQIKHERSTQDLVRAAVSGWLGTALEFMDFQLYSLGAALVFHEIFFPEQSAAMALILAMGTYGAGYIARIIGAFVFGKMGDRIGRKKVLFITITMMGICTTLIGVLPTYAQIGIFAPVLLVTLRIIQGLGAGAEISGAGTMLAEYAPKGKRGIISSLVAMGTNCGTLSATAIWLRMNLKESPVFEKVSEGEKSPALTPASENTLGAMFTSKSFWLATGLRFGQAGNSGLIQTFLAGYLVQTLLFNKSIPTDALMISSVIGFITIPLLGWLSDKYGRRLPYIILNISAIILAWPMLSIVVDKMYSPGVIMAALIVIHNFAVLGLFALENITMAEIFGSRNRFTRMAISKEAGGLVAVGFGPVLAGIFCNMTDSWLPILIMLVLYSCIGLISALLMPEVRDRDLSLPEDAAEATAAEKLRHSATQTS
ncbi:MFS transporter [Salmonella sp. NW1258]|uniref:MFS transporter n=1 Tax=Salmonella enterica subsp. enterica serovar Havana TaxID=179997 RepID=A0A3V3CEC8_SALET|nr:MFS transporter [Salmonella enterica]EDV8479373.1 MHS family MFS transporter [Salmonella enterica subsp. enterica serovar Ohio]EEH7172770.1 MHS family MFS transporter [Salmonella enterica subsp. enterica]EAA7457331.1 MFS transporter [Salmonella enterica subsp. enterica serovar Havana]EAA9313637.1 MFS transporter [Salmonella enterica subsp. enterica serovar Havana]EAB2578461.1 MFS transporter [Salmonella enterica]